MQWLHILSAYFSEPTGEAQRIWQMIILWLLVDLNSSIVAFFIKLTMKIISETLLNNERNCIYRISVTAVNLGQQKVLFCLATRTVNSQKQSLQKLPLVMFNTESLSCSCIAQIVWRATKSSFHYTRTLTPIRKTIFVLS